MLTLNTSKAFKYFIKLHKNCSAVKRIYTLVPSTPLQFPTNKDSENDYAFRIIKLTPLEIRDPLIFVSSKQIVNNRLDFERLLDQDWRKRSAEEITDCFKSVLDYCVKENINVSDTRFDKLVDGLMDKVQDLTDTNLADILECLTKLPYCFGYDAHNYHDIWSALDDVCCWKIPKWSNETMFRFAEFWYRLNLGKNFFIINTIYKAGILGKFSDYLHNFIDRMYNKVGYLTKNEIVHLFFYVKIHRRLKPVFLCHSALDKCVKDLSIDESAVVAMTFARFGIRLKLESTSICLIDKLKEGLLQADDISIWKVSKYLARFIDLMMIKVGSLTRPHLIGTFFYINVCRKRHVDLKLETVVEKHVHHLNLNEMTVIAMGFFKSSTKIRSQLLLTQMIEKLKSEIGVTHEIALTSILKVLRYSSYLLLVDKLIDLLDHLVPEIDRLSNVCCTHIALLGTTLFFFHPTSLAKISQKVVKNITDVKAVRLKDMERLLLALTMFNFVPHTNPDIFNSVYQELHKQERRKEFVVYRRSLESILNYLSMREMYSYALMNEILDKERIHELYGKNPKHLPRDVFVLDVNIDIDCPDYIGNRLDIAYQRRVVKWMVEYSPTWDQYKKISVGDRFVLDVTETVAKIVNGHNNLLVDHVLPHYVKSVTFTDGSPQKSKSAECQRKDVQRPRSRSLYTTNSYLSEESLSIRDVKPYEGMPWFPRFIHSKPYYTDDYLSDIWHDEGTLGSNCTISAQGVVSLRLHDRVRVDVSLDKAVRIMNYKSGIVLALSPTGSSAALLHPNGRVYQYAKMWYKGVSFTSDQCALVYLVDSAGTRTTTDSFSDLTQDFSVNVFYSDSPHLNSGTYGSQNISDAITILQGSNFWITEDGTENWIINNIRISQTSDGLVRSFKLDGQITSKEIWYQLEQGCPTRGAKKSSSLNIL
ncbi:hypothetical protein FQA39_LY10026 [Lamprigera yunnana]|nr:hypothetical protein FQA39_LY10026 [Lamprigera yunnana]